jgi:hypothetical protein
LECVAETASVCFFIGHRTCTTPNGIIDFHARIRATDVARASSFLAKTRIEYGAFGVVLTNKTTTKLTNSARLILTVKAFHKLFQATPCSGRWPDARFWCFNFRLALNEM